MAHVLVVDDMEDARAYVHVVLESAGHIVSEAPDGQAALDRIKEGGIDLVLSDGLMPVMDGFRLCLEVRKDPRYSNLPFIIHTASFLDPEDERLAADIGADGYLFKPTEPRVIIETVERLLSEPRMKPPLAQGDSGALVPLLEEYSRRIESKLDSKSADLKETRVARDHFRSVLDSLPLLVATLDAAGSCDYLNLASLRFSEARPTSGTLPGFLNAVSTEDAARVREAIRSALKEDDVFELTVRARRKDGHLRTIRLTLIAYVNPDGQRQGVFVAGLDATEEEERKDLLLYLAEHDALTDLPNRRVLDLRFGEVLGRLKEGDACALLFIDIDGLKAINDDLGHDVGDTVLVNVARLLTRGVRSSDLVVRLCGDEFVVLAENVGWDEALALSESVRASVAEASLVPSAADRKVTVSIGVNVIPEITSPADALRAADEAMYRAKAKGRDQTAAARDARASEQFQTPLAHALDDPDPVLDFLPIYSLSTGALIRCATRPRFRVGNAWHSHQAFMAEAIGRGVSRLVSESVIEHTLDAMAGTDILCSIRLSLADLLDSGTFQRAENEASRRGIDSDRLLFEVELRHVVGGAPLSTWLSAAHQSRIRLVLECSDSDLDQPLDVQLAPFDDLVLPPPSVVGAEDPMPPGLTSLLALAREHQLTVTVMGLSSADDVARAMDVGAANGEGSALGPRAAELTQVTRSVRIG